MDLDSIEVNRRDVLTRVRRACVMLPDLGAHMAASLDVKQRGDGRGSKTTAPLPYNDTAVVGVHSLYAMYADLCESVRQKPPAPSWRDENGKIVGLSEHVVPSRVYVIFTQLADIVHAHAESTILTWPTTDVLRWETAAARTFRYAATFPLQDAPEYASTPCICTHRVVIFPPEYQGDEPWMVCSGCGRTYTAESLMVTRGVALAVAKYHRRLR